MKPKIRSGLRRLTWGAAGAAALAFFLYPFLGLLTPVGRWQWDAGVPGSAAAAVRVSLELTGLAMLFVIAAGTPLAWQLARERGWRRWLWEAPVLLSMLLPPLALGLLLALSLGPSSDLGRILLHLGLETSNSRLAFVLTQIYVSLGYYVIAARAAFAGLDPEWETTAALLGQNRWQSFRRVTLPLARLGLAAALSLAWVRALGEFGAIVITAYYPSGMPVQLWVNLQDSGLPGVMPLLVLFLLIALPLPWAAQILAARRAAPRS